VPDYNSVDELLGLVAQKKGLLKPGGISNLEEAARAILRDFLNGKIMYYTAPPPGTLLDDQHDDDYQPMEDFEFEQME
jgi:ribosome biogenesis GTPase A